MSAFMCSDRHLGILAAYAVAHVLEAVPYGLRSELERDGFEHRPGATYRTISRVASMLMSENPCHPGCSHPARRAPRTVAARVTLERLREQSARARTAMHLAIESYAVLEARVALAADLLERLESASEVPQ